MQWTCALFVSGISINIWGKNYISQVILPPWAQQARGSLAKHSEMSSGGTPPSQHYFSSLWDLPKLQNLMTYQEGEIHLVRVEFSKAFQSLFYGSQLYSSQQILQGKILNTFRNSMLTLNGMNSLFTAKSLFWVYFAFLFKHHLEYLKKSFKSLNQLKWLKAF